MVSPSASSIACPARRTAAFHTIIRFLADENFSGKILSNGWGGLLGCCLLRREAGFIEELSVVLVLGLVGLYLFTLWNE
jgi:hypothetical protein